MAFPVKTIKPSPWKGLPVQMPQMSTGGLPPAQMPRMSMGTSNTPPVPMPQMSSMSGTNGANGFASFLAKLASSNRLGASLQAGVQQGTPSIQGMTGQAPMGQMPAKNPMELFGNTEMTIDQFGQKFGLDYSREYAERQAAAIQKAKQDSYNQQLRQVQSGVEGSVNNIDRNYYLDGLKANQQQVNNGINAGLEADQELRLAMNRQNAMGDIYRDANNQTYAINDGLGRLEAEKIAYADQLYNDRRENGYKNATAYNQLGAANAATYAEHQRLTTADNRGFALKEGELMGNYVPYEARGLIQTVLNGKDQLNQTKNPLQQAQILENVKAARIQLAAMGVNVDRIGTTSTFNDALNSISSMNKTMDGQNNDMGLAQESAKMTGNFIDPRANQLYQTLLSIKKTAEVTGRSTPAQRAEADRIRGQLEGMGVDVSNLAGANIGYSDALANASKLGVRTLDGQNNDMGLAQEIAAQTGVFTNPQVQLLYNTLLNIKQTAEARGKATPAEVAEANRIRGQLTSLGVDANRLIGGNVGYAKALENARQLGTTTQDAKRQSQDILNEKEKLALDRLDINNTYDLGVQKNQNDYTLGLEQNAIDREKNAIDLELGKYDYELGLAEQDYKIAQNEIDLKKAEWEQGSAQDKANAKAATNAVTAELMQMSKPEAIAAFGKHYSNWIDNGVDVIAVMKALGLDGLLEEKKKSSGGGDPLGDFFTSGK